MRAQHRSAVVWRVDAAAIHARTPLQEEGQKSKRSTMRFADRGGAKPSQAKTKPRIVGQADKAGLRSTQAQKATQRQPSLQQAKTRTKTKTTTKQGAPPTPPSATTKKKSTHKHTNTHTTRQTVSPRLASPRLLLTYLPGS